MRLINTSTIQLHDVVGDDVLYVILSHRWEGAEVTFQDMMTGEAPGKEAYAKIVGCCEQARKDGFDFVVSHRMLLSISDMQNTDLCPKVD